MNGMHSTFLFCYHIFTEMSFYAALFYSDYATVNVYFENDPIPKSALDQIRRFWGNEADSYTYVRAKYVTKGNVLPEDLLFENKESR